MKEYEHRTDLGRRSWERAVENRRRAAERRERERRAPRPGALECLRALVESCEREGWR